jgi:hypothetical protein
MYAGLPSPAPPQRYNGLGSPLYIHTAYIRRYGGRVRLENSG